MQHWQIASVTVNGCFRRNFGDNPDYDSENQAMNASNAGMGPLQRVEQLPPRWQKFSNSKCKIPTEPLISLKTSDRGCSSIRFSHNGYFLAYAEVSKSQNNVISISQVNPSIHRPCFSPKRVFHSDSRGPECCPIQWTSANGLRSGLVENGSISGVSIRRFVCQVRTRDLPSTSVKHCCSRDTCGDGDRSSRVWNFERVQRKPWRTLSHPSFVYCVRFHPLDENIVVTAGYDKQIRVWTLEKKHGSVRITFRSSTPSLSSPPRRYAQWRIIWATSAVYPSIQMARDWRRWTALVRSKRGMA